MSPCELLLIALKLFISTPFSCRSILLLMITLQQKNQVKEIRITILLAGPGCGSPSQSLKS